MRPIVVGGRQFGAAGRPHIVGVVNLSPESPNKDSIAADVDAAVTRARRLVEQGAAIIDVGAQSSHFSAPLLPESVEIERLVPAVRALKAAGMIVSVDTWREPVARAALDAGADIINDSDGFQDPAMSALLAGADVPIILPFISGASPHDPAPFTFDDPNFTSRSLRGTAVLRWEYRPGSTMFFVWTQQRSGSDAYGDFDFRRDARSLLGDRPDNVFLVKATYWIGR